MSDASRQALHRLAHQCLADGVPAIGVTLIRTSGSTPQPVGARMLISGGRCAGTIGGGHLEWRATQIARTQLLQGGVEALPDQQLALGPSLGQCCGGTVQLRFERLVPAMLEQWAAPAPAFQLSLYGMGHVADALVRVLASVDCQINWYDTREALIEERRNQCRYAPGSALIECHQTDGMPLEIAAQAPRFALVMTHRHDLDLQLCERLLRQPSWNFVGLIGSATKRARFTRRLSERGVPLERIAALRCPIGSHGLASKEPGWIAVAVAAELLLEVEKVIPSRP